MSTRNFIVAGPRSPKQCGPFIPEWRGLSQRQRLETWMIGWHWSLKTLLHMDSALDKDCVVLKWRPTVWTVLLGGFSEQKGVLTVLCARVSIGGWWWMLRCFVYQRFKPTHYLSHEMSLLLPYQWAQRLYAISLFWTEIIFTGAH